MTLLLALASPIAGWAHPHVFVDTGIELITDESGKLTQVKVTSVSYTHLTLPTNREV